MASITLVKGSWRALVRRKGYPTFCQTFPAKKDAEKWARDIEQQIDKAQIIKPESIMGHRVTVGQLIDTYRKLREKSRPVSDDSTEHYTLKALKRGLGPVEVGRLAVSDLVGYAEARKEAGAGPYTVNMDIGKLGTVLRLTAAHLKLQLRDVVGEARPLLNHMGLIGGGGKRDRRPSEDEIVRLIDWLEVNRGKVYADVVRFAIPTALRRGEVVALRWADVDAKKKLILVRDRKDPRQKVGNDQWIPLLNGAWELLQAQPKGDLIFPVHPQTVSKYFKQACDALGIPDLHFHDLRHDGISRLFEQGFDIPRVAMVSGHKSWNNLKRYTNLRPEDLHHGPSGLPPGDGPDSPPRP